MIFQVAFLYKRFPADSADMWPRLVIVTCLFSDITAVSCNTQHYKSFTDAQEMVVFKMGSRSTVSDALGLGKVTVGLALHWPCVVGFSGSFNYGLMT